MHTESTSLSAMDVYASSKLAQLLLFLELDRRLRAAGNPVDSLCVSPGMVDTGLWRNYPLWYQAVTFPFRRVYLRSPDEAARGVVYCLVSPAMEANGGKFLYDCESIQPSASASDVDLAAQLWTVCDGLVQHEKLDSALALFKPE